MKYYHGTHKDFPKPKLNGFGVFWVTPNPIAAREYGDKTYVKDGKVYVWEIELKANAKLVNLRDLKDPVIRHLFDQFNEGARHRMGPWSEADWEKSADFGLLEWQNWMIPALKKKRVDGVIIQDKLGTTDIRHSSIALLRLSVISGMERAVLDKGQSKTIGEIEQEMAEWEAANKQASIAQRVFQRWLSQR